MLTLEVLSIEDASQSYGEYLPPISAVLPCVRVKMGNPTLTLPWTPHTFNRPSTVGSNPPTINMPMMMNAPIEFIIPASMNPYAVGQTVSVDQL